MFKNIINKRKHMEKVNFEIRLVHNEPVDLIQMANSLISLQNIVSSHIGKEFGIKDSKILLKGVKEGSDIYQLALDFGMGVLPFIDGINTITEAMNHIRSYLNIDRKTVEEIKNSKHYNTLNSENIKNFVAPIVHNKDNSKIEIKIEGNNNNVPVLVLNSQDGKNIYENADYIKKIISNEQIEENSQKKIFEKVLIKMYKATDSIRQVKDSAYCDDIVKGKAIATLFENIEDKKEVLVNPFSNLFLVDIEIVKLNDEVKLYRVLKLHNIIESDEL